jgi:hypothetical protein
MSDPTVIALAIFAVVFLLMALAIFKSGVEGAIKLWSVMGALTGVAFGGITTFYFKDREVGQARAEASTAKVELAEARAATNRAEEEQALAKAKDEWGPTSTEVPKMIDAAAMRVESLEQAEHLRKGVTKDQVASAKSGFESLKLTWADATKASEAGDYTTAMAKAQLAKDKAAALTGAAQAEKPRS